MTQPLDGLQLVDLSGLAGAYAVRMFAGLGANVVKVEPPAGNPLRRLAPHVEGVEAPESSLWWAYFAMGARSVVIDTDTQTGRDELGALLKQADIVVHDASPGSLESQGLGYDDIRSENAGVIWVSITPYGKSGPKANWKTSNLVAWASSGALYTVGFDDQSPVVPGGPTQLAFHTAGMNAAIGTMMALRSRRRSGSGQRVDISIAESALGFAPEIGLPVFLDDQIHRVRNGNRRPLTRPMGLYPCSDGYVSMVVVMPRHWQALAEWISETCDNESVLDPIFADFAMRGQTMELIDGWVEELTQSMTLIEVFQEGQRRGIPITPVNTIETLSRDEHLKAVKFWQETELPTGGSVTIPGAPMRTHADWWINSRAPRLGEHTEQERLRMSANQT